MKYLLTKTIILFFLLFSTGQTNDDIKKLENEIKKVTTDIAKTLKIEVAIKGKKLKNFFINNDLILISENGSRKYKFKKKTYEIIKDDTVIQNGSWKVHGLLKNQIRLISDSDKKKYYLKKISQKPWIYSYDKRPGSEGAEKEILHIKSSSKFTSIASNVTFSSSNENSEKLSKKNENKKKEQVANVQKTNEVKSKEKKGTEQVAKIQKTIKDEMKEAVLKDLGVSAISDGKTVLSMFSSSLPPCEGDFGTVIWSDCQAIQTYSSGDKYIGEFKNNKRHGYGIIIWEPPMNNRYEYYIGEWHNGYEQGKGVLSDYGRFLIPVCTTDNSMTTITSDGINAKGVYVLKEETNPCDNLAKAYFCKGMKCSKEEYDRTQERENKKRSAYANVYSEFDNCLKIYDYLVKKMYTYSQNTAQYNLLKNLALETKKMIKTSGGYDSNSVSWCQDWMIMAIEQTGGL